MPRFYTALEYIRWNMKSFLVLFLVLVMKMTMIMLIQQEEPSPETIMVTTELKELSTVVGKMQSMIKEEHTIVDSLKTIDFWILFVPFLCGVSTGFAVQDNVGSDSGQFRSSSE
ncbi:hypothetical protein L1887_14070 [Cichorium endivia]|nr:hypothetical protein L1887_14070 [Cichorium endivia]